MSGDFAQASSPLLLDGDSTPFQVADARHRPRDAAEMLLKWSANDGCRIVDTDADGDLICDEICVVESFGTIVISVDGKWFGSGKLVNGRIEGCAANFCDEADESEAIYQLIEEKIEKRGTHMTVEIDGLQRLIEWSIED
jgi:hypothetical protein